MGFWDSDVMGTRAESALLPELTALATPPQEPHLRSAAPPPPDHIPPAGLELRLAGGGGRVAPGW